MKNKGRLRKWLWLGLDEETAKKYQRKLAEENIRTIRNESLVITLICMLYSLFFLRSNLQHGRGIICTVGVCVMFGIFLYSYMLMQKRTEISKEAAWLCMGAFMACCYITTIYLGTYAAGNELAVTAVCLFVFLPTNFDILPIYNIRITFAAMMFFFVSSYLSKTPDKFIYDVMDGTLAFVIGNFASWERAKIKWESVVIHERLEEERDTDMLTGIWNRRAFEREVNKLVADGGLESMAVIMVDIDKFKKINDCYGHEVGDAYLKHFCELLREFTWQNTIVGRRSGDEFFMFIYNYRKLSNIEENVKKVYQKLASHPLDLPDGTTKAIRASAGIVWSEDMEHDWRELLCAADEALYYIKEHGRNNYTIEEYCKK